MAQQAALQASMMGGKKGVPQLPMMPMMPPHLMKQMMESTKNGKKPPKMTPEMIKFMKMQVQIMQQIQKVHMQTGKPMPPMPPMPPMMIPGMMPFMMPTGSSATAAENKVKPKAKRGRKKKNPTTKKNNTNNMKNTNNTTIPSPLSSPERRKDGYDIFGGSPITPDDLQSLLSPTEGSGGPPDFNIGVGGMSGRRRGNNSNKSNKLSPRYSETGSDGGVDFMGDIDHILSYYKEDEDMGVVNGQLAGELDRVNLDDDLVFDLQPTGNNNGGPILSSHSLHHTNSASSNVSNVSMGSIGSLSSMVGSMNSIDSGFIGGMSDDGKKKKKSRPKLEQMPSDAFQNVDLISPFTGSFEWANQVDSSIPNSMTTPNPLSSPTNLFSPGGMSTILGDLDGSDL